MIFEKWYLANTETERSFHKITAPLKCSWDLAFSFSTFGWDVSVEPIWNVTDKYKLLELGEVKNTIIYLQSHRIS